MRSVAFALSCAIALFSAEALACPTQPDSTNVGVIEFAGCSVLPNQYELHWAYTDTPLPPWDGVGWLGRWRRMQFVDGPGCCGVTRISDGWNLKDVQPYGQYWFNVPWDDQFPLEIDECGEPTHHGRGAEKKTDVRCGEIWSHEGYADCTGTREEGCIGNRYSQQYFLHYNAQMSPDVDVNRDNVVDSADEAQLLAHFGHTHGGVEDVDQDGVVGDADHNHLISHLGQTLDSFTVLGHTQRYYTAPIATGSARTPETHLWSQRSGATAPPPPTLPPPQPTCDPLDHHDQSDADGDGLGHEEDDPCPCDALNLCATSSDPGCIDADLDKDHVVGGPDMRILAKHFGCKW